VKLWVVEVVVPMLVVAETEVEAEEEALAEAGESHDPNSVYVKETEHITRKELLARRLLNTRPLGGDGKRTAKEYL
jgi:hypothetical protein